ncbi:ATP-binding cassette domain-containing protein [Granulicella sp. 5B5]|uniref:ABC transporter ATP-binding protein n=1 Tax=Granulicella sp. 5B5 TaxID=1617967 RepID=UPI0015F7275B|nr:ATP-binding cassette domain-containing protein [Granulicella sp. 5B5]QMV17706.1 ATP-binding cassette domain-containing protein [Granulicella sp. 5B5]
MDALVDLQHVNVARGNNMVLHDLSLRIEAGEHVVILGPNGCGKSTLLKTMTCECYPVVRPETQVSIMGRERWDLTELKRRMGVVSAELPGRQTLTTSAFDAVLTGFFSSSTLWPNLTVTDAMRAKAEEILVLVGAEALREKPVGQMSAGQQRRVMIGRALAGTSLDAKAGDVKMLLLDEPSNALDLGAQHDLRELLRGLAQKGTAILLITHHIADILPEMDRVVMMREGRVIADGSKQELLTANRLSELFGREISLSERGGYWNAW